MLPDRVSNPGPLAYESGALPIALRGQALAAESMYSLFESTVWVYVALSTKTFISLRGIRLLCFVNIRID